MNEVIVTHYTNYEFKLAFRYLSKMYDEIYVELNPKTGSLFGLPEDFMYFEDDLVREIYDQHCDLIEELTESFTTEYYQYKREVLNG